MPKGNEPHHIAIIGAGSVGTALAKRSIACGHSVTISNSRGPESLHREEQLTGAKSMDIRQAVVEAKIVVIATPIKSIPSLQRTLQASLRPGTILLDTSNYYPTHDGHIQQLDNNMPNSVWVSTTLSYPVIKAFNNIIANNMIDSVRVKNCPQRVALPVSGDDEHTVAIIMNLIEEIGFDAFTAGTLGESWRQQPGQPAYRTEPNLTQLPGLLSRADRKKGLRERDRGRTIVERLPLDFPPLILLRVARLSVGMDRWKAQSWVAAVQLGVALLRAKMRQTSTEGYAKSTSPFTSNTLLVNLPSECTLQRILLYLHSLI